MRVRKVSSDDVKLYDLTQVKLKTAGNTSVIQFTAGNNKSCPVRNLSKDEYLDKKTGEVKEKKKSDNRYQSPKSVRKSINRLMDLIRCNATDPVRCKWITVTYEAVMTDGKQAFLDAKLFLRRLKRYLAKQIDLTAGQKSFQYITVAEPQGESHGNSWHLHILLIFEDTAPFIANETIAEIWGYGITSTHKVFDAITPNLCNRLICNKWCCILKNKQDVQMPRIAMLLSLWFSHRYVLERLLTSSKVNLLGKISLESS